MWEERVVHVLEEERCGVEDVEGYAVGSVSVRRYPGFGPLDEQLYKI